MLLSLISTILGLVALAQAVDHPVVVGGPGGVVAYNPPSVVRPQFHKRLSAFLTRIYITDRGGRRHRHIHVPAKEPYRHRVEP